MEHNVNQNKNKIEGFTIIELLVAMVIFSLILIFMLQSFLLAFKINFSNEVKNTAVRIAQDEIENLRAMPLNQIYNTTTGDVIYCPSPCNPDTTDSNCKVVRTVKGVNITFGKSIEVNTATETFLDINLTVCSKIKDWRTGNNITYSIRTILSEIGE